MLQLLLLLVCVICSFIKMLWCTGIMIELEVGTIGQEVNRKSVLEPNCEGGSFSEFLPVA